MELGGFELGCHCLDLSVDLSVDSIVFCVESGCGRGRGLPFCYYAWVTINDP